MALVLTTLTTISLRNLFVLPVTAYSQTNARDYAFKPVNSTTNLTNQITNATGIEQRRVPSFNGKLEPSAISGDNSTKGQLLTTQMIANQLTSMTPDKIANFPLKDLSSTDLVTIFNSVTPAVLEKTLNSISDPDLSSILGKIPVDKKQQVLDRLSSDTRQQVLDRLTGQLFK